MSFRIRLAGPSSAYHGGLILSSVDTAKLSVDFRSTANPHRMLLRFVPLWPDFLKALHEFHPRSGFSGLWRGHSPTGCVSVSCLQTDLLWPGLDSLGCERPQSYRMCAGVLFSDLPPLGRSGFSGLWRGHSPTGCVLGSCFQICLLWAGLDSLGCERPQSYWMCVMVLFSDLPPHGRSGFSELWEPTVLQDVCYGLVFRSASSRQVWILWAVRAHSPTGCVLGSCFQICLLWAGLDSLSRERPQSYRMCAMVLFSDLPPHGSSGFSGRWRGGSLTGCVLWSCFQICLLWAVLVSLDCEQGTVLQHVCRSLVFRSALAAQVCFLMAAKRGQSYRMYVGVLFSDLPPLGRSGFSGLWRGDSPTGCVLGSCYQIFLSWAVLVSLGREEGAFLQDVCWGLVFRSASSGRFWFLWALKRRQSYRMRVGVLFQICLLWAGLVSLGCKESTVLQGVCCGLLGPCASTQCTVSRTRRPQWSGRRRQLVVVFLLSRSQMTSAWEIKPPLSVASRSLPGVAGVFWPCGSAAWLLGKLSDISVLVLPRRQRRVDSNKKDWTRVALACKLNTTANSFAGILAKRESKHSKTPYGRPCERLGRIAKTDLHLSPTQSYILTQGTSGLFVCWLVA